MTDLVRSTTVSPGEAKGFFEKAEENPCDSCSAPCCRLFLLPYPTPTTFMDMDYLRYVVGFQSIRLAWNVDGSWQVMIEQSCQLLDPDTNVCTVHGTPRKPMTCQYFNPHRCWYRRNFHNTENPPDLILIDMEALEAILSYVKCDEGGALTEIPTWEFIKGLVQDGASPKASEKGKLWVKKQADAQHPGASSGPDATPTGLAEDPHRTPRHVTA